MALEDRSDLVADLVDSFDLVVTEQGLEYGECGACLPFVEQGKPVLDAEYANEWVDDEEARAKMRTESARLGISLWCCLATSTASPDSPVDPCGDAPMRPGVPGHRGCDRFGWSRVSGDQRELVGWSPG